MFMFGGFLNETHQILVKSGAKVRVLEGCA